jgi:hypothetical protein
MDDLELTKNHLTVLYTGLKSALALSLPSECVLLNGLVFRDIHSSPS